jgi:signal peptidase I
LLQLEAQMEEDGEIEEGPPSGEEEAEEQEPQPEPPYDPLTEPWNDPAATSVVEYRLSEGHRELAPRTSAAPRYGDPPYAAVEELSELRRRLREETVVVPKRKRVWAVTVREMVETLLLAVLIFLAVHVSMQNFKVEGASMEPSLDNGEYLIVNRLAYAEVDLSIFDWVPFFDAGNDPVHHLWGSPSRGDVIVFRSPTNVNRDFIKRIIGVPGDVVEIDQQTNVVKVNGQVIEETYIRGETTCRSTCGPWVVPERSYFVMGDNRNNSSDSRQGWFVPEENIIGKALITYWHDGSPDLDLAPNHEVSIVSEAAAEE